MKVSRWGKIIGTVWVLFFSSACLSEESSTSSTSSVDGTDIARSKASSFKKSITTLRKERLFPCADKVKDGKSYNCRLHKYRIPSILVTVQDTVLAFASKRKENLEQRNPPGAIGDWKHETDNVVLRSTDKGKTWSKPIVVASRRGIDIHRGPVLIDERTNTIYSFMRFGPARISSQGVHPLAYTEETPLSQMRADKMGDYVSFSTDDGRTWSNPIQIFFPYPRDASGAGVANGSHGIQLSNGRFVIQARYKQGDKQHRVLFYSNSTRLHKGSQWNLGAIIKPKGINMSKQEFTIAESPKNVVLASFRTGGKSGEGRVLARIKNAVTVVKDPYHVKQIAAPNVHASLIRKRGGFDTYFLSLPGMEFDANAEGPAAENRKTLYLYRSVDGAKTWHGANIQKNGRYAGYSDMGMFSDGSIALIFESGQKENYEFMLFKHLKID